MKTIRLSDYNEYVRDGDHTTALAMALRDCKEHSPVTLLLGGGELHFYKTHARREVCYVSNNDAGEKAIVFPLYGFRDLTVDGEGAALKFHGEVCPFVIDGSEGVTLKNFSIDYQRPYFLQATVVSATEDSLVLDIDKESMPVRAEADGLRFYNPDDEGWERFAGKFLVCEFDKETKAPSSYIPPYFLYLNKNRDNYFLARMYRYVEGYMISETRMGFKGHFGHVHNVGNKLIGACGPGPGGRNCPGIFGNRSKNTVIENVTLYASGAMGIICQVCENVTLRSVRAVPNEALGRYLSVSADATHFVNCLGDIVYEDCVFTNMMDDASNVHGIYYKIKEKKSAHELLLTYGHRQQVGVNVFDTGDRISIVNNENFASVATLTVKGATLLEPELLLLETEEEIPDVPSEFTVEDLTKNPNLYVRNCITGHNRPRGFLPATRGRIEIVGCTFFNMNSALHFAGDCNSWYEASAVENVLIQGNKFRNSAYAGGVAILMNPHSLDNSQQYHRNVTIIENEFEMRDERFINASLCENLVFKNNRFKRNDSLPRHAKPAENGIRIVDCVNAEVEEPKRI